MRNKECVSKNRLKSSEPVIWSPSLKVRTSAFQAEDTGFNSRGDHCDHRIMVVQQIVDLLVRVRVPLVTLRMGCLAAKAADCKSVTRKHRRFESYPIHLCLRVREVYGPTLLRWCAFIRTEGSNPSANVIFGSSLY